MKKNWKKFTPTQQGDGAGYSAKDAEYRQAGNTVEVRLKLEGSKPQTLQDDPEVKAGWGWINLNFLFKPWAWHTIIWHDEQTLKDSWAAKTCITGKRLAQNFGEQLRELANKPRNGWRKLIAKLAGGVMPTIQPPFYEGPESEAEREVCLKEQGRNEDGSLKNERKD